MGQCCSSKQHLKKKKTSKKNTRNASTLTSHYTYYGEITHSTEIPSLRHLPDFPGHSTDSLVNRDVFEALVAHFCNCSYSTRCPHRPQITPVRRQGYRRYSEQDAYPRPTPARRTRRITAPSHPTYNPHLTPDLPFPDPRYLSEISEMGAPIHSSTLLADHEDSCQIHQLGLSCSRTETPGSDRYGTLVGPLSSTLLGPLSSTLYSGHLMELVGYKFQPQKELSEIEKSVIWV